MIYIDGLVQDCGNSIANALELLQSCTKPSICLLAKHCFHIPLTETSKVNQWEKYFLEYVRNYSQEYSHLL